MIKFKYPAIDLLKLCSEWTGTEWVDMLRKCVDQNDVSKLTRTYYGLQRGMDMVAKAHMNNDSINTIFLRLQKSIEASYKKILRKKYPCLLDTPTLHLNSTLDEETKKQIKKDLDNKRRRDFEFNKFLAEARF